MFGIRLARILPTLLLAGACTLFAQAKVAIINSQKALLDTAEMVKAQKDLEAKYKPRQDQMETIQKDLQQIQNQLQTMARQTHARRRTGAEHQRPAPPA
jgi:Skp family chaperone for outer membrane proteins